MNKTLKLFLFFTLVLFFALVFGNINVYATDVVTLTQADFTEAKNNPETDTGKMKYLSGNGYAYYFMTKSNYKLDENINIGTATIAFYPDFVEKKVSLDLSKYTIENGTTEEYGKANIFNERKVIIFEEVNAKITGTGTIKSNSEDAALYLVEYDNIKSKNQEVSNIKIQGRMCISKTKATINKVNIENGALEFENSDITINGGTYKNLASGGAISSNGSNVTISNGTFTANLASAMYFFDDDNNKVLTINNGTFTSTKDNGIEIDGGIINLNGGTFTGAMSGITTNSYKTLKISGGTYKYTDTKNGRGPIALYNVEVKDAVATIAENKVLSTGEFKKVEKEYDFGVGQPWTETYVAINTQSVTVQSKNAGNTTTGDTTGNTITGNTTENTTSGDKTTENTTSGNKSLKTSSISSSDSSNVKANIKFTTPISKGNKLEIKRQNDDKIDKKLTTKEPNLKAVYDINVVSDSGKIIKIENNKMTIKIKLDEDLLGYDDYQVVYIEDGKIEETIQATVKDGYIIFETSHLSEYGIIASNSDETISDEQTTTNPKTGDNIIMYIILSVVAIVGISLSTIIIKRKK